MAINRRMIGMKSGNKDILEYRLYNKDGSRTKDTKAEDEFAKSMRKRLGLIYKKK